MRIWLTTHFRSALIKEKGFFKLSKERRMIKSLFIIIRSGDIKNFQMFPHTHNCYELVYYYDTIGKSIYEQLPKEKSEVSSNYSEKANVFHFKPNTYILLPPNTLHNEIHQTIPDSDNTHIIAIGFETSDLAFPDNDIISGTDGDLAIYTLMEKIKKEYTSKNTNYSEMINAYLTEIVVNLIRNSKKTFYDSDITYAKNYIDEYYIDNIDLNKLADDTGYTPEHFRLLFKKHFDTSPKKYIINKRMEFAQNLLKNTELPIQNVAEKCGYYDYKHFSATFIKVVGESPSSYRKEHFRNSKNYDD